MGYTEYRRSIVDDVDGLLSASEAARTQTSKSSRRRKSLKDDIFVVLFIDFNNAAVQKSTVGT